MLNDLTFHYTFEFWKSEVPASFLDNPNILETGKSLNDNCLLRIGDRYIAFGKIKKGHFYIEKMLCETERKFFEERKNYFKAAGREQ